MAAALTTVLLHKVTKFRSGRCQAAAWLRDRFSDWNGAALVAAQSAQGGGLGIYILGGESVESLALLIANKMVGTATDGEKRGI